MDLDGLLVSMMSSVEELSRNFQNHKGEFPKLYSVIMPLVVNRLYMKIKNFIVK